MLHLRRRGGLEGIDGIIDEDRLGLDTIYVQAKRREGTVGRPEIQKFVGALHGKRPRKDVFITTGTFSGDAKDYVSRIDPHVVLIDGRELAQYMLDFDLRALRDKGRIEEAAQELARFRAAFTDADARLPADLRPWADSLRR